MLIARMLLFQIGDREMNCALEKKIKSNILSVNIFHGSIFLTIGFYLKIFQLTSIFYYLHSNSVY